MTVNCLNGNFGQAVRCGFVAAKRWHGVCGVGERVGVIEIVVMQI